MKFDEDTRFYVDSFVHEIEKLKHGKFHGSMNMEFHFYDGGIKGMKVHLTKNIRNVKKES
jgi:hypothetical protein